MLPGPLVPETKHSLIIVHPAAILAVSDPSVERLKCSWHLGMMMRIIETLLLKGKSDLMFCRKTLFSQKNTLTNSHWSGCPFNGAGYACVAELW